MSDFIAVVIPKVLPWLKMLMYAFVILVITAVGVIVIINAKRKKWKVTIREQKADGRLHIVSEDTLYEKKLNWGTKTIYWMKKNKCEVIPPPDETVYRFKRKEYVDYLRVERNFVPLIRTINTDYNNKKVRQKLAGIYDGILLNIRKTKTALFDAEALRNRFLYIPINQTLTSKENFTPIEYDMNMMAMNEINNADEFFKSKYEFWKKYGAVITFGLTIVFLIIIVVLTYDYVSEITSKLLAESQSTGQLLKNLLESQGTGGSVTPPVS